MRLEETCHGGAVRFRLESAHPPTFNLCCCSSCRRIPDESVAARQEGPGLVT